MNTKNNNLLAKILKYILLAIFILPIGAVALMYVSCWIFPQAWGSYNLGNNLYLIYWEKDYRYIVFSNDLDGRVCKGGWPVIPSSETMYDNDGNINESVISAKADSNWIIAMTVNSMKENVLYHF